MTIIKSMLLSASLFSVAATAHDHHEADSPDHRHNTPASALYLGNEGVLVSGGDTQILFDPLFDQVFNRYEKVPEDLQSRLLAGQAPFESVDVVFISHYHGDHFSPELLVQLLKLRSDIQLVAPRQAVDALTAAAGYESQLAARMHPVTLDLGQDPTRITLGQVTADIVRIPHSGWPERMTDVENLAYRVTLNPDSNQARTVLHIGDADTRDQHYAVNAEHWASRPIHMAFPPYWYFTSLKGRQVLVQRLKPIKAVGVHVPASFADDPTRRPPEYSGFDLFTRPGEERQIPNSPP